MGQVAQHMQRSFTWSGMPMGLREAVWPERGGMEGDEPRERQRAHRERIVLALWITLRICFPTKRL